jgi:hypothetical protein
MNRPLWLQECRTGRRGLSRVTYRTVAPFSNGRRSRTGERPDYHSCRIRMIGQLRTGSSTFTVLVLFLVGLLPGVVGWWNGRGLSSAADDPALPQLLLAR